MSEIDRVARLESCIRGVNAWNTGLDWYHSNYDRIYSHRDGSPRRCIYQDHVANLIRLSESLCTRHRSALAHFRDLNPLKRDDIESDLAISMMRHSGIRLLIETPDDPDRFRQRIYMEFEGSEYYENLVDHEFRSSFHEWYLNLENRYDSFISQTDEILLRRTNGIVSLDRSSGLEPRLSVSVCDWTDDCRSDHPAISDLQDRFNDVISLHPMRMSVDSDPCCVYATIERDLPYRENDGHQFDQPRHIRTPETLAGRVLQYVGRYYGADQ